MECPCEQCISLAICKHRNVGELVLTCHLVKKFLKATLEPHGLDNFNFRVKFISSSYEELLRVFNVRRGHARKVSV